MAITERKLRNALAREELAHPHALAWHTVTFATLTRHYGRCDTCRGLVAVVDVDSDWKLGRIRTI